MVRSSLDWGVRRSVVAKGCPVPKHIPLSIRGSLTFWGQGPLTGERTYQGTPLNHDSEYAFHSLYFSMPLEFQLICLPPPPHFVLIVKLNRKKKSMSNSLKS